MKNYLINQARQRGEKMIKPQNCTKEELLYFIKNGAIYSQVEFEACIKQYRSDKYCKMAKKEYAAAEKLMKELIELRKKYDGYKYDEIPEKDNTHMKELFEAAQAHFKKSDTLWDKSFANI